VSGGQAQLTTQRIWPNTLEYIMLILGGTFTKAYITNLQVRLGQKTIWYITGTDVQTLNSYEGRTASAAYLSLNFSNAFARTPRQQYLGAIDMGQVGVRDLTILITISSSASAPTLSAYAEVAPPKVLDPASNLLFRALIQTPLAPSGATTFQPFLINYGQAGGALLRRLLFAQQSIVTALEIKRDGLDIFEQITTTIANYVETELTPHVPQSSNFIYDAVEDNIESKALTSVRADSQGNISIIPQQINISHSGSGSYNAYADVFANLNGL
jgi:hypothetical protein